MSAWNPRGGKKPRRLYNPHLHKTDEEIAAAIKANGAAVATPIGEAKRKNTQWEAEQAQALEGTSKSFGLFQLHRVEWLHFGAAEYSRGTLRKGFPDYFLSGVSWIAFLEIKARNKETKKAGTLSEDQKAFHAKLRAAGCDVMTALLPDELAAVNDWLYSKTGIKVAIDGLIPHD